MLGSRKTKVGSVWDNPIFHSRAENITLPLWCDWVSQIRREGEHIVLTKEGLIGVVLSIPNHKEVSRKLLQKELKKGGVTEDEYLTAFGS